ncbi:MAG: hypothetical protein HY317_01715 [Acidobacteria bacterium]|nr:hypothetical protein [Acidobacteriota bacterium]
MRPLILTSAVVLLAGAPALHGDEGGKTEITVFLGVSLQEPSVTRRFPDVLPVREGPGHIPQFEERTRLGGSFLQGFRVGRTLGDRVTLEVGLSVAPTHERRFESDFPWWPYCPECVVTSDGGGTPPSPPPDLVPVPVPGWGDGNVVAYAYDADVTFDLATGAVRPYVLLGAGGVTYDSGLEPNQTDFRLSFGGGLRLGGGAVSGRLEVADALTPDHFLTGETEHDVQVRCGVSVRVP